MEIRLDLKVSEQRVLVVAMGVATLLLLMDTALFQYRAALPEKFRVVFDITLEANIPTWYSVILAFVAANICLLIMLHYYRIPDRMMWISWLSIALFFVYLSMDDASQFHERIATVWAAQHTNGKAETGLVGEMVRSFGSYHWQLLFLPIFALFGLYMAWMFYREVTGKARIYLAGGLACFVVAVFLDYLDGTYSIYLAIMDYINFALGELEHMFRAAEEYIEMLGLTFFITGFLSHYSDLCRRKPA